MKNGVFASGPFCEFDAKTTPRRRKWTNYASRTRFRWMSGQKHEKMIVLRELEDVEKCPRWS